MLAALVISMEFADFKPRVRIRVVSIHRLGVSLDESVYPENRHKSSDIV